MKWFWRIYLPVATMILLGVPTLWAGPFIETWFWPVRIDQRIEEVVRTPERLCWTWVSVKTRLLVSDNMDVILETASDRMILAAFERDTSLPWGRSRAVGLGPHRQPYCVLLPPNVDPREAIRLIQTAYYPGWLGLWHIAVHVPDVIDPHPR